MKRRLLCLLLAMTMVAGCAFTGCGKKEEKPVAEEPKQEEVKEEETLDFAFLKDVEFTFASGVGGWFTSLRVSEDGSFAGHYQDSDMGDTGEGYDNGVMYYSDFQGKFKDLKKVDDYTYKATVESLDYSTKTGTEEIKDDIKFIYCEAYGISNDVEVEFYLPGKPTSELTEEYIGWVGVNCWYGEETPETLDFYGLYNVNEQEGFSGYIYEETGDENVQEQETEATTELSKEDVIKKAEEIAAAAAAKDEEIQADLQKDHNQTEYNFISRDAYDNWDEALNDIWALYKENLDEELMKNLTDKERQWIKEKDQKIKEAGAEYEGGSIQPMVENLEGADLTKERVYFLIDYIK